MLRHIVVEFEPCCGSQHASPPTLAPGANPNRTDDANEPSTSRGASPLGAAARRLVFSSDDFFRRRGEQPVAKRFLTPKRSLGTREKVRLRIVRAISVRLAASALASGLRNRGLAPGG
jgi:hypothetical protein